MAEILALGISHYPPLTGRDDRMSAILRRMMQNPKLPADLRTPEGWPAEMRAEWGDDQGTRRRPGIVPPSSAGWRKPEQHWMISIRISY